MRWWKWQRDGIDRPKLGLSAAEVRRRFASFAGEKISIANVGQSVADPTVVVLKNMNDGNGTHGRLSQSPGGIYTGQNSGYQAVGVAVLRGAKRIVLVGYDMKAEKGQHHFFGDHPVPSDVATYRQFRDEFRRMAPNAKAMNIEILNATIDTDLDCFPRIRLEDIAA